jgi:hypothetical protein
MKYNYLALLIVIWWAGAAIATVALIIPVNWLSSFNKITLPTINNYLF